MFSKVLIANRGEIAVRVLRACREMGVRTAVAYAAVDRSSLAVRLADEAYLVEGPDARGAYLNIEGMIEVAKKCGAEAVHPGYGFLSENAQFSKACREAGIVFIGPSPEVIHRLGDKNQARAAMATAGVPLVPGTDGPLADGDQAVAEAERIGYPVLLKAAGGGGGRGMRRAHNADEVRSGFEQARREALAAFGSPSIYLEKYIERPRHIEIQILGDNYGEVVYLHERECSIQRRFQKMIEEAPSPLLDEATRHAMGEAAVAGAKKVGYAGAGTFEFLADDDRNFYFLEVNTRLQVEHPVTEMITGIDLVEAQLRVAAGEKMWLKQEEIPINGWAIECRITCEDPFGGFRPCPGKVEAVRYPGGPGVRFDSHLYPGYVVPVDFDSMVGKLIAAGDSREQARRRMLGALDEMVLAGFPNSVPFHRFVLNHPVFVEGHLSTHFLDQYLGEFSRQVGPDDTELAAVVAAIERFQAEAPAGAAGDEYPAWRRSGLEQAVAGRGFSR